MAPVLGSVGAGQRVPLVEHMVTATVEGQTIRIVQQTNRWAQMENRTPRVFYG